ncbi:3-methyladenine DNA glycosylase [Pseudonocardia sp. RS11V-5]|uniref:3-methyladenine DNA glycosylase n=1 Tax=Pseudonocardia terrae TaxID=2905831 RepID=UPI001E2E443B|nr:3-methyladenine DNA glycosylase [Pseudonocardia terrae]MCE3551974.1 3-methyladenine DNA glycosylase [Pseudonocardia terrae]
MAGVVTEELDEPAWRARAAAHRTRMERWTLPHRERRRRREPHPVQDFLFTYYSLRPAQLEQWQPGPGVRLLGDIGEFAERPGYRTDGAGVVLDPARLPERLRRAAGFVHGLVSATAARPARYGCFGLHEWAMVYRTDRPRHGGVPLRLGPAGTDAVVESLPVTCTHHDAFRFFTAAARPLNRLQPRREDQVALEQPGCLHATMDLYKWAYKLLPATPAELLGDCFALAAEVRELDMRASPYDLADRGYAPVPIETPGGRAEYARAQQGFAERAAPLRDRLLALCAALTEPAVQPA